MIWASDLAENSNESPTDSIPLLRPNEIVQNPIVAEDAEHEGWSTASEGHNSNLCLSTLHHSEGTY